MEIDRFVSTLSELERKIFKLAMTDVPVKEAHKEVGISKGKYLKLIREVGSKATFYIKG